MVLSSTFIIAIFRRFCWGLLAMGLFVAGSASLHAGDAVPGTEMQKAFGEFASLLNQSFTRMAGSGLADFSQLDNKLPEAKKCCDA